MSNRFYVNDVQIFGNNEMFKKHLYRIGKARCRMDGRLYFWCYRNKRPQGLMDAVEKDSLEYLKKCLTKNCWSNRKNKFINKPFSRITDKHLLLDSWNRNIVLRAYTSKGDVRKNAWLYLKWWVEQKRIFTSLNLYFAIKNEVELKGDGKLELKKDGKIIACMY